MLLLTWRATILVCFLCFCFFFFFLIANYIVLSFLRVVSRKNSHSRRVPFISPSGLHYPILSLVLTCLFPARLELQARTSSYLFLNPPRFLQCLTYLGWMNEYILCYLYWKLLLIQMLDILFIRNIHPLSNYICGKILLNRGDWRSYFDTYSLLWKQIAVSPSSQGNGTHENKINLNILNICI